MLREGRIVRVGTPRELTTAELEGLEVRRPTLEEVYLALMETTEE